MQENIVKKVCKELGLTYKQLGEKIGYSEGALKMAIQRNNVSPQMQKAIELYLENLELKNKMKECEEMQKIIKKWVKE